MELGFSFFLISFRQMQEFIRTVALLSQEHPAIFFYAGRNLIVFEKTSVDPHFRRDYRDFTKFCSV